MPPLLHAFTVDVEDYFQVSAFERSIRKDQWESYESRVVENTHRLLRLLAECDARGTFFVLGWVAERFPGLVRDIHRAGHEIGTHSFWHRLVYEQTPDEFRADLARSCDVLAQIVGEPIRAYRAPSFSITHKSQWALPILAEQGITCDSSIFPILHDRYGMPGARRDIHRLETAAGSLVEFPPAVLGSGRTALPVGGGGYFRLYPWSLTRRCLAYLERQNRPLMFYTHPWEVDPAQPRLPAGSWLSRARHYVNLSSTYGKLQKLLTTFRFGPMRDVIAQAAVANTDEARTCCAGGGTEP